MMMRGMAGEHPRRGGLPDPEMHQAGPLLGGGAGAHRRLRPQQARGEGGEPDPQVPGVHVEPPVVGDGGGSSHGHRARQWRSKC